MLKTIAFLGAAIVSSVIFGIHFHDVGEGLALFAGLAGSYLLGYIHHGQGK